MARRLSRSLIIHGAALALTTLLCSHAQAQTQAFTFTPDTNYDYTPGYRELGIQFQVASTLDRPTTPVYALGFYDSNVAHGSTTQGLKQSHQVGIFSVGSSPRLLAQATVQAGTASTLIGDYRYTDQLLDGAGQALTAPLILTAGSYMLVGISTQDKSIYLSGGSVASLSFYPNITFFQSAYIDATTLTYPTITDHGVGYFSADFLVTPLNPTGSPAPVPEPGAFALLGGSLTVLGAVWRRRRATKRAA